MIKFVPQMTSIVMEEIPDRVTLAVDISNCQGNCIGCHSPFLKEDVGEELTRASVDRLFAENFGVDCFLFLGEGNDPEALLDLAAYIRERYHVALALYSGRKEVEPALYACFDYVKVGPYIAKYGPLNERTTNQRLYRVHHRPDGSGAGAGSSSAGYELEDLTPRFWHKGIDPNVR